MRRAWMLGSVALILATFAAVFVRGTWAADAPRDPPQGSDAPVVQVLRLPDGSRQVRAALRLAYSPEEVWAAITDYENYGDICSFLHAADLEEGPTGCRARGRVDTGVIGTLPYTLRLNHRQDLHEYASTWDDPSDLVPVNRGGWLLRAAGEGESILAIHLEVQVRYLPTFVLRNLSRQRLPAVLRAVERRLAEGPRQAGW